jgi:hypothetical protein
VDAKAREHLADVQLIASDAGGIVQSRALYRDAMWRDLTAPRVAVGSSLTDPQ